MARVGGKGNEEKMRAVWSNDVKIAVATIRRSRSQL